MERIATFDRVGTEFVKGVTAVGESGIPKEMAFTVRKEPMGFLLPDGSFQRVVGTSTIVNNDTGFSYGPVSDKYAAIDNVTALGCLQYIDGLEIKRFGDTKSGMQFIIGSLPECKVLGDSFLPYLIFRNSFNGRYPIQCAISPLRIVCQNQLTMAFKKANNTFNIRHTYKAQERLEEAQKILLGVGDFMTELNKVAEEYAAKKISKADEYRIISEMFPITDDMSECKKNNIKEQLANFQRALNEEDNLNFKGTAWGFVNAMSDYLTHPVSARNTPTANENNFIAVTFDPRLLMKMMSMVNSIAS